MAKKHKILGAIAGLVGVAVIATGVYFAVPKIVNKSWGEILHIGEEKPPAEKSKLTLNTNGNLTFICVDDKGTTYTEEELEQEEWQGETLTFTLAPNDGYMLWSTKVNGQEITLDNNMLTVTMDQDTTIDVDVQEIKEYTANIVEDRYSQWQLTVNGEPLNSGDTIRTGDLISGRVISLTSGYKTGTFLVNDVEYVYLLDKYGFIQEPIRIENTELPGITFSTSTVRDVSSLYVPFDRFIDTKNVISNPTYSYTSEICSVYNITNYGLRVGEEVKMDFTITNSEYFGGITLNGEPLEVRTAEDGVTASCTFIVPATECTLEVVSSFEEYSIPFEYDESYITLSIWSGSYGFDETGKNYVITSLPTNDSFQLRIETLDKTWADTSKMLVEIDGDVVEEFTDSYGLNRITIPYTAQSVKIYFEELADDPIFEPYSIIFDVDSDLTVRSVASWQIVDGTMTITEQPTTDTFTIRVTCLGAHTGEDLVVTVNGEEHARETFELGQAYEFEIPYTAEDVSIYFEEESFLGSIFLEYDTSDFSIDFYGYGRYVEDEKKINFMSGWNDYTYNLSITPSNLDFNLTQTLIIEKVYENSESESLEFFELQGIGITANYVSDVRDEYKVSTIKIYYKNKEIKVENQGFTIPFTISDPTLSLSFSGKGTWDGSKYVLESRPVESDFELTIEASDESSIERYLYIAVDSGTGDFSNVIYDAIYTGPVIVSIPYTSARVAIALV